MNRKTAEGILEEMMAEGGINCPRCAELEAKLKQCSLDNECYVCPPLRCGTFKRGPAGCEPLKAAEQKKIELEREIEKLRAGLEQVREIEDSVAAFTEGKPSGISMGGTAVLRERLRAALDLAGVDHG